MPYDQLAMTKARRATAWNFTAGNLFGPGGRIKRPSASQLPPEPISTFEPGGTIKPPSTSRVPLEPLSDDELARLRAQMPLIGSPDAGNLDKVPSTIPPRPLGDAFSFAFTDVMAPGADVYRLIAVIPFPVWISDLILNVERFGAALIGYVSFHPVAINGLLTTDPLVNPRGQAGVEDLWYQPPEAALLSLRFQANALGPSTVHIPLQKYRPHPATSIVMLVGAPAAGTFRWNVVVVCNKPATTTLLEPVINPIVTIERSLRAAPLPAPAGPALPRGVRVSVLVAGRPSYGRDIAWASLDVELKKQFLNAQLSGDYPPTLQPIW